MERPSWTIIFVPVVGIRLRLADCYANTVAVGVAVTTMSTGDWQLLYERYYRRRHLYDMAWPRPVQLSAASRLVFFEAASFGGPFAYLNLSGPKARPEMQIYTSSGILISSFSWKHANLLKMGWSNDQSLVCVNNDGRVFVFSIHGDLITQFTLGKEASTHGLCDCCITGDCIVAVTDTTFELIYFHGIGNPVRMPLAQPDLHREPPSSMVVVPGNGSPFGVSPSFDALNSPPSSPTGAPPSGIIVIVGTQSGTIIKVEESSAEDQMLSGGPFVQMALSPDGTRLACFGASGTLHCLTSDFKRNIFEFGTTSAQAPLQMAWCTNHAVVLTFEHHILLVGELGYNFVSLPYDTPTRIAPEIDGVRIVTASTCEFLEQVPKSTESLFTIGSIAPGAMLYDAAEALEKRIPNADENIRTIIADPSVVKEAIQTCLHAAQREFDVRLQKRLLKAASIGKLFFDTSDNADGPDHDLDPDLIRNVVQTLRMLNTLRSEGSIAIPLTFDQLEALTPSVLIDRLLQRNQHVLCLKICEALNLDSKRVLLHWAIAKVNQSRSDVVSTQHEEVQLARLIVKRLSIVPSMSLAPIATAAFRAHRPVLAITLCDNEKRPSAQVPLLISMNEEERALDKAIASGDTDLIFLCLQHLRRSRSHSALFSMLQTRPLAQSLLIEYARQSGQMDLLKNALYALQMTRPAANLAVQQAYKQEHLTERLKGLQLAAQFYYQDKRDPFWGTSADDQIKLLQVQSRLEAESATATPLVDRSVSETIDAFLAEGKVTQASKLQQMFKVPAKRFWHIQVQVYARTMQWAALYALVDGRKTPPIGFAPFVEACIANGNLDEAVRYVALLPDTADRMEWLCNMGRWKDAVQVAVATHDLDALRTIQSNCAEPDVLEIVEKAIKRLS
ncbi:unnamed protein product (mitochondrion) [Plasmodiophora brassicae]|uniref:Vacuolar protein sorting-associated protein 16 homolog n=2 Tax=Plasmodiophora brassicae TaxID=37360 RepID=A0A3P3YA43_PLABS|nr:unnamed protein product [Plasmodiophora brassicae]